MWVSGACGLVGKAVLRRLKKQGCELLTPTHKELDLTDHKATENWVSKYQPHVVFALAGRVGGIEANRKNPCEFLFENSMIALNTIHSCANVASVEKLVYLGPACAYPKLAQMPLKEESLLTGEIESTNEAYALAKILGVKLCQYYYQQHCKKFISAISTNTYGPDDNHKLEDMHVVAALFKRFKKAKENGDPQVTLWGTGAPLREFIYVDDLADALIFIIKNYDSAETINIGSGEETTIYDLAHKIKDVVAYTGEIIFDTSKPNGVMRKLLDTTKINALGWSARTKLEEGLLKTV